MSNPQLHPLEVNPKTGEPFLRLRKHKNIILTPPREEDAPAFIPLMNDPRVCDWLSGPPYPYILDHAKTFIAHIKPDSDQVLRQLEEAKDNPTPITVGHCPVRYIREVKEDGTDVFIGDVALIRCLHGELMGPNGVDWKNKQRREEENNKIPVGDPSILWSMGDFLAPSHHRKGIMTDAVETVLHEWGIPRMAVRHMWVAAFTNNEGSVRVFQKNGFKLIATFEEHFEAKGRVRGLHLLEWKHESHQG
ncbi:hypothetical protein GALMADRAFT_132268 [Galerina marginata CBS 339.88]|uniref:N-acetyltransferase domain-containing protein n=1 Tax=Galerina marginata (strain CBS 339.88) TaxID=685588 RepID=A0A067TQZ2_GALM3|nr:hypothetical protein GALMADRAFT_132268 [Galerina marginata CBS 339.88]